MGAACSTSGAVEEITFPVVFQADLAKNEYPAALIESITTSEAGGKNLCAKYATAEQWKEYAELKTKLGFQFRDAINTGLQNPTSYVGCHFGDFESYTLYKTFFDNVLSDYHKIKTNDAGVFDHPMIPLNADDLKVDIEDKNAVVSSRVRCARNLVGDKDGDFGMAPGMKEVSMKLRVEAVLIEAFKELDGDLAGTYYSLDPDRKDVPVLSDAQKVVYIKEKHMLCKSTDDQMQVDSGYHKWFPKGRGFYVSKDEKFCCWINEGDHLRIISMQMGGDVKEVLSRWMRAAMAIEAAVLKVTGGKGFMQVPGLGYFACCPSNLGTGTRASVHICLPKLLATGKLGDIALGLKLQMRGTDGEHSKADANGKVGISNKFRLGYTEIQLATFMISGLNTIVSYEKRLVAGEDVSILDELTA